jgi:hypothetical protein
MEWLASRAWRQERDAIDCIVTDTGVLGLSAEILRLAQHDNAISG